MIITYILGVPLRAPPDPPAAYGDSILGRSPRDLLIEKPPMRKRIVRFFNKLKR